MDLKSYLILISVPFSNWAPVIGSVPLIRSKRRFSSGATVNHSVSQVSTFCYFPTFLYVFLSIFLFLSFYDSPFLSLSLLTFSCYLSQEILLTFPNDTWGLNIVQKVPFCWPRSIWILELPRSWKESHCYQYCPRKCWKQWGSVLDSQRCSAVDLSG